MKSRALCGLLIAAGLSVAAERTYADNLNEAAFSEKKLVNTVCRADAANPGEGTEPSAVKKTKTSKKTASVKKVSATHPFYRTALSDLRTARWVISHHPVNWQPTVQEGEAVAHIDAAIAAIVKASINDGKGPKDRPKAVGKKEDPARLEVAMRFLKKARVNISRDGDQNLKQGLQLRAYEQIDGAIGAVRKTLKS